MISEIIIGKKYKVVNARHTRIPLYIHNDYVFYEHDYNVCPHCDCCRIEIFKTDVEEIPETPEEWFEVIHKLKGGNTRPCLASSLFRSKEDFLNAHVAKESDYEFIKLRKVEL